MHYPKKLEEAIVDALHLAMNIYDDDETMFLGAIVGIDCLAQASSEIPVNLETIEEAFREAFAKLGCGGKRATLRSSPRPFQDAVPFALALVEGFYGSDTRGIHGAVMGIARVVQFTVVSANHDDIGNAFRKMFAKINDGAKLPGSEGLFIHLESERKRWALSSENLSPSGAVVSVAERPRRREPTVFNAANFRKRREPLSY